jgi:hypothetical protein
LNDQLEKKIRAVYAFGLIKDQSSLFTFEPVTVKDTIVSALQNSFEMIMVIMVVILSLKSPSFASAAFMVIS